MTAKNNTQSTVVYGVVSDKLEQARTYLVKLKEQQRDIDLKIEDYTRVVLALERTEATLSVALDPVEEPPKVDPLTDEQYERALERELEASVEQEGVTH